MPRPFIRLWSIRRVMSARLPVPCQPLLYLSARGAKAAVYSRTGVRKTL